MVMVSPDTFEGNFFMKWGINNMANILIAGANQGIGYYLTKRLLELGNSVTVLDIQTDAALALREKYQKTVLPVIADVRNLSSIENGVRQSIEHFGDIDIAIHNACLCTFESEHDTSICCLKRSNRIAGEVSGNRK